MDVKVSKKEVRLQPGGPVEVLVDNVFDLYPVFANDPRYEGEDVYIDQNIIPPEERKNVVMDVEILDDDKAELLDRAMFALVKQRGADPIEPSDGVQWAQAVLGEVVAPVIIGQVYAAVSQECPGVRVVSETVKRDGKESLVFRVELTNAI